MFNILLQVLDDGRLTDNKGRVVNFKNTIIIMTSNLLPDKTTAEGSGREASLRAGLVRLGLRPEFLNRVDDIIEFQPLCEEEIRQIVGLQVEAICKQLAAQGVTLHVEDDAISLIACEGYDPEFGARPVKRALQRMLLNDLSTALLGGHVDRTKPISVKAEAGKLVFRQS